MGIFDALYRAEIISTTLGLDDWQKSNVQWYFMEEDQRAEEEKNRKNAARLYELSQRLRAFGEPVPQKTINILRRYGYDVSEFLD